MRLQSFEACVAPQQILDLRWPRFRRRHGNAGCFVALVMHHAFPVRDPVRRNRGSEFPAPRDERQVMNRVTPSPGRQEGSLRSQPPSRVASPSTKRQKMAPCVVDLINLSQKPERRQDGRSRRALATEPLGEVLRSAFRQEERQGVSCPGSGSAPVCKYALLYVRKSSFRLSRRQTV